MVVLVVYPWGWLVKILMRSLCLAVEVSPLDVLIDAVLDEGVDGSPLGVGPIMLPVPDCLTGDAEVDGQGVLGMAQCEPDALKGTNAKVEFLHTRSLPLADPCAQHLSYTRSWHGFRCCWFYALLTRRVYGADLFQVR